MLLNTAAHSSQRMRLATWVFGSGALLYQAELYGGLAVFSAYVVYDTQVGLTSSWLGASSHGLARSVRGLASFCRGGKTTAERPRWEGPLPLPGSCRPGDCGARRGGGD